MIKYDAGSFGINVIFRLHGSAVFKSIFPALLSSGLFLILYFYADIFGIRYSVLYHPYPMTALIASLTFLLAFRANFAYNRYWEAFTAVHQMHSKWVDVGMEVAAFHLQCERYNSRKPPAFGAHPELTFVERERERINEMSYDELKAQLAENEPKKGINKFMKGITERKSIKKLKKEQQQQQMERKKKSRAYAKTSIIGNLHAYKFNDAYDIEATSELTSKLKSRRKRDVWENEHPLFLEECAHLLSLLSAVALSTLRNDLGSASSPLISFIPGEPLPHVDPDDYDADVRREWTKSTHRSLTVIKYLFGSSRTPAARTLYNAARPFRVIGGVSDAEIEMLQAARGPLAKVALCSMWLTEFITREYLSGSTGAVAPPILSRLYQYTSDGMLGYNQARKIAYIPFPFPHAQITSSFVFAVAMFLPVLMLQFVTEIWLAFVLNFLTVMSFNGLHEVARELENPFMNVPNDVPCNNFQAQFNEALMQMFSGYHPDAHWEVKEQRTVAITTMSPMKGKEEVKEEEGTVKEEEGTVKEEECASI